MITNKKIIEALKKCIDPEIGIDIYTLGLIYDIKLIKNKVKVKMTLTSPMCPYGPMFIKEIKLRLKEIKGIKAVDVELVFDQPWQPTEEVKLKLGV